MDYIVKGHFYYNMQSSQILPSRSVLTITDVNVEYSTQNTFDLLVVMMNPGKSKPKCSKRWFEHSIADLSKLTEAVPDATQYQIMKVMSKVKLHNALILNISDICETESNTFCKNVNELEYSNVGTSHSVFSPERGEELNSYLSKLSGSAVVIASGVDYILMFFTKQMLDKMKGYNLISSRHENGLFYHPLPRFEYQREEWVSTIVGKLS